MTSPNDAQEAIEWLERQADMYMAGDDKFAYRLKHIAELLRSTTQASAPSARAVALPRVSPMELLDFLGDQMFRPYNRLNKAMWDRVNEVYKGLVQLCEHYEAVGWQSASLPSETPAIPPVPQGWERAMQILREWQEDQHKPSGDAMNELCEVLLAAASDGKEGG